MGATRRRMSDEADRWRGERRPSSHFPAPASGQLGEGDGSDTSTTSGSACQSAPPKN